MIDLLITNAKVFTADPDNPHAEAVGITGDRIVWVGSAEDAQGQTAKRTIDAQGASLIPGIIDTHYHLLWGSLELDDCWLNGNFSETEFADRLRRYAADNPQREFLVGRGIGYAALPFPLTRQRLDAVIADRPLIVVAYDSHTIWANTEALRRGGILNGRATPPGSEIVMGEDGTATGELREPDAARPIRDLIPGAGEADIRRLLHKGLALAAENGITSLHNMNGDIDEMGCYAALDDLGELTCRVSVPLHVTPDMGIKRLAEAVQMGREFQAANLRGGRAKFFMDGVIESTTALMLDDYADAPGNRGSALFTAEHFTEMAIEADRLGLQIAVHAIGDAAVRRTLDGYEAAQKANGVRDSRHRVEHIEIVHPDDVPRFAALGVIASMQPLHAPPQYSSDDVWLKRAGDARWERSFAWQTLRSAGARLVFGSDWPVVSPSPMLGLQVAVTRKEYNAGNQPAGASDQQQTLSDALVAYTRDAAYAGFSEDSLGQIKAGYQADLVLLSADLFTTPPDEIGQVRPMLTMVGGRIVHSSL